MDDAFDGVIHGGKVFPHFLPLCVSPLHIIVIERFRTKKHTDEKFSAKKSGVEKSSRCEWKISLFELNMLMMIVDI